MPGPSLLPRPRPDVPGAGRRLLLLGAVLIGLLALQLLSGHDAAGGHRVLAPARTATTAAGTSAEIAATTAPGRDPATAAVIAAGPSGGNGFGIVAGCALLLLAGALVALTTGTRSRSRLRRPAPVAGERRRLRGPPDVLPRIALCVERI